MTSELHPSRDQYVTASRLGNWLGLSAWADAETCIRRDLYPAPGEVEAVGDKDAVVCGKYLEPLLIRLLREQATKENMGLATGTFEPWPQERLITNDHYPWLAATPDVLYREGTRATFYELKTTNQDYSELSDMPAWHLQVVCQIMAGYCLATQGVLNVWQVPRPIQTAVAQLARLGAPLANYEDFLCDSLRNSLRRFPVALSVELAGVVDEMGKELHQRFIVNKEDPKGWKPDTQRILRALYPVGSAAPRTLSEDHERDVRDLMAMKRTVSDLEERIAVLREKVIANLGGSSKGLLSDGTAVTYTGSFRKGYVKEVAPGFSYSLRLPRTKAGD